MTTAGDDRDPDDPMTSSMRSVWVSMRDADEEPPQRGMAALLAAARAQAEVMKPKESWWRRSFALLVRPPVLAAATVVVLVGGAVLVNNRSAELDVVAKHEGERERPNTIPLQMPQPERAKPAPPEEQAPAVVAPTGGDSTWARQDPALAPPPPPPPPPKLPAQPRARPADASKPETGRTTDHLELGVGGRAPLTEPAKAPDPGKRTGEGGLLIAGDDDHKPKDTKDTKTSVKETSPPPSPNRDVVAGEADVDPSTTTKVTRGPRPRQQPELVDQLVKQAQVAASRKDCAAVRVTAERVKKLDGNAYKTRVANQPAIASCLR